MYFFPLPKSRVSLLLLQLYLLCHIGTGMTLPPSVCAVICDKEVKCRLNVDFCIFRWFNCRGLDEGRFVISSAQLTLGCFEFDLDMNSLRSMYTPPPPTPLRLLTEEYYVQLKPLPSRFIRLAIQSHYCHLCRVGWLLYLFSGESELQLQWTICLGWS